MLDKAIKQQLKIILNTLTSTPSSKVYSAGIIAEISNVNRFQSQASVAKFSDLIRPSTRSASLKLRTDLWT